MSDGTVEEILSCGWNWMVSSEGRDGGLGGTPDVEGAVRAQTAGPLSPQ